MLALMVLCLVVVDLIMLVVYSAVEGAKGSLGASLIRDKEFREKVEGVSIDKHCLMEVLYFSRERKYTWKNYLHFNCPHHVYRRGHWGMRLA